MAYPSAVPPVSAASAVLWRSRTVRDAVPRPGRRPQTGRALPAASDSRQLKGRRIDVRV